MRPEIIGQTPSSGNLPNGLAVADVNGDGRLDLLVGNVFGDVLTLLGNGDGTFQPYQRVNRNIALAVADLNGDGRDDFIFGNEALDRVSVQYSQLGQHFEQDRQDGLLAPGALQVADLNRDGSPDLVVANSGANNVLVYLGMGNGQFAPAQRFFAGTNPVGLTITHLNDILAPIPLVGQGPIQLADPYLDVVVANQGSNDVTVLLGQGQGSSWTLRPGPRLQVGTGPVATTVQDVTGPQGSPDGLPDILAANRQSNTVSLLPAVGNGFFADQGDAARLLAAGQSPQQVLVGNFDRTPGLDLLTVNAGSNDLTLFSNFGAGRSVGVGGVRPVAAVGGDFNQDGTADLIVANNGDGRITLLLGGAEGPTLARVFASAEVLHPTALALGSDGLVFYVSSEGEELVASFTFDVSTGRGEEAVAPITLDPGVAVTTIGGGGLATVPPGGPVAELVPLRDSALATVALLLTVAGGGEATPLPTEAAQEVTTVDALAGILVALAGEGQAHQAELGGGDEEKESPEGEEEQPGADVATQENAPLESLILGLEAALVRRDQEFRKRLLEGKNRSAVPVSLKRILDDLWSHDLSPWTGPLATSSRLLAESLHLAKGLAGHLLPSWLFAPTMLGDFFRFTPSGTPRRVLLGGAEGMEMPLLEPGAEGEPAELHENGSDRIFREEPRPLSMQTRLVPVIGALVAGAGREPGCRRQLRSMPGRPSFPRWLHPRP